MYKFASLALVPGILITVALVQQYRAHVYDQSSWVGCGFGMFATLDNHTSRFVQAKRIDPKGERPYEIPAEFDPLVTRVRVVPTQENLDRLAEAMSSQAAPQTSGDKAPIQLALFHIRFDPQTNQLSSEPRRTAMVHE